MSDTLNTNIQAGVTAGLTSGPGLPVIATVAHGLVSADGTAITFLSAAGDMVNSAGTARNVSTPQTLTGAGAVNITTRVTLLVTTGANALTLADGASGQEKVIVMKTDGGDGTLTPAHLVGGTTLTFNDAGDSVLLCFNGTAWAIVSNNGATLA